MSARRSVVLISAILVILAGIPYLAAFLAGDQQQQFGGFLINPVDGHSYLAKMRQGFDGEWRFKLPFTPEPGQGAYLFLFYILLGHLAGLINAPLLLVYHAARLVGAVFLIVCLSKLAKQLFLEERDRILFLWLAALGSGLGWIAALAGAFTSDFWVAEAYPFLSSYTNPHFTIGLALMVLALIPESPGSFLKNLILGGLIAIIQPFGVVIIGLVKVIVFLDGFFIPGSKDKQEFARVSLGLVGFGLGAGPYLIYQYWAILSDPVLSAWHLQNQTPTPGLADILLSLSPVLVLALLGIKNAWRKYPERRIVIWAAVSLALVIIPWSLQRRFLTGIYVPLAGIAIWGLRWLTAHTSRRRGFWVAVLFVLALPTNLLVIGSGWSAASRQDPQIYLSGGTADALRWLNQNAERSDLVAARPELGLLIPAASGTRVIYGHPFETIDANEEKEQLESFFTEKHSQDYYENYLTDRQVDYVWVTESSSRALEKWAEYSLKLVYQAGEHKIYQSGIDDR